jgi:DNA-binding NarL/FixJ family response regulator
MVLPRVGLIEQNPLALPYLQYLLREGHIIVRFYAGMPTRANSSRKPIAVFVVDVGTLLVSLDTFLQQMRDQFPASKILLIGHKLSHHQMSILLGQGIDGFVTYSEVKKKIVLAIRAVLDGKLWFPSETLEQFRAGAKAPRLRWESVTTRERRIIGLLEQRLSNKQAAAALNVSENTIKFHLSNIFRKLDVHDRQSAAVAYISSGLGGRINAAINHLDPLSLPAHSSKIPRGSHARFA